MAPLRLSPALSFQRQFINLFEIMTLIIAVSNSWSRTSSCFAWKNRHFFRSSSTRRTHLAFQRLQSRLFSSSLKAQSTGSWNGDMKPFSEYAMHVQVGEEDTPVSVQDAILRSMGDLVAPNGGDDNIPKQEQKLSPSQ